MAKRLTTGNQKFYCPKCSKKTLLPTKQYSYPHGGWQQGFECSNQPPARYRRLVNALNGDGSDTDILSNRHVYWGYEAMWGDDKANIRVAQQEEVTAYLKKNPPCDCKIYHPERDAKISDHHTVLDLMIRDGSQIQHYLLEKDSEIHKRGFEVLHSTDLVDVVRMRDGNGVGVWLYWKCTWEPGRERSEVDWHSLTHKAAAFLTHRDTPLRTIFYNSSWYPLWAKPERREERSAVFRDVVFTGSLGKRKKAQIVDWVKELEAKLRAYENDAVAAVFQWESWSSQLRESVKSRTLKVGITNYNASNKTASIAITGWLTQDQIERIAEALKEPAAIQ